MKKILSILLALTLVLSLPVFSFAESADILGVWYADFFGIMMQLDIQEDGTCVLNMQDENKTGTWEIVEGKMLLKEGEEIAFEFTVTEEGLYAQEEGQEILFTREKPETFQVAPVKTDAVLDEFQGNYVTVLVNSMGVVLPPDMIGMSLNLMIEKENATLTFEGIGMDQPIPVPVQLKEGVFQVELPASEGASKITIALAFHQDMSITCTFTQDEMALTFILFSQAILDQIPADSAA